MSVDNDAVLEKLLNKFETDIIEVIHREASTGRLTDGGTARLSLRSELESIFRNGEIQLEDSYLLRLYLKISYGLKAVGEFALAAECFKKIIEWRESASENNLAMTVGKIEAIVGEVECDYAQIDRSPQCRIAPMAVSKILRCVQRLRSGLEILVTLSTSEQESLAWLFLNCCKAMIEIAQPLVWVNGGKYIVHSLFYAANCMETVINLCTWRHLPLRMKLYSTSFYGAITQLGVKEAHNILIHVKKQLDEIRQREQQDPPLPERVEAVLVAAEIDGAVLAQVLAFWKNPDAFVVDDPSAVPVVISPVEESAVASAAAKAVLAQRGFGDRCLCECARVQKLTAGNPNEMWKKRSSSIVKAFWKVFEAESVSSYGSRQVSEDSEAAAATAASVPASATAKPKLTLECLSSMTAVAMFDIVLGVPIKPMLSKVWEVVEAASPADTDADCLQDLTLLRKLAVVIDAVQDEHSDSSAGVKSEQLSDLIASLHSLLFSDEGHRRVSLLHRVSIGVWTKFVYSRLQLALSSLNAASANKILDSVSVPLMKAVEVLDLALLEDPVFVGSLAAAAAAVLHHVGDLRGSISILKRAIECIDNHRASRVDALMVMPEDARDATALQRASVSISRDHADWFHGVKRLGAHAFAGFGVFGAGSSADQVDLAVADIHSDLIALFFRYEIEYSIQRRRNVGAFNSDLAAKAEAAEALAQTSAKKTTTKGAVSEHTSKKAVTQGFSNEVNAQKLNCVIPLQSFCAKNPYLKSILALELARVDSDKGRQAELLDEARQHIVEAETREAAMKDCLKDLAIVSDGHARPPVVLARTHRSVYVVPTGTRHQLNRSPPVHYFRVLAKEQGSGTDITINSDFIGGTEAKVLVSALTGPQDGIVEIGPLRPGERYVFGCAGFAVNNDVVGAISPTTVAIEALNPLPTVLLWGFLNRTAQYLDHYPLVRLSALRVCDRFFDKPVQPDLMTLGKGVNLFVDEYPLLCMLTVKQSSLLTLETFVRCFVTLEPSLRSLQTTVSFNVSTKVDIHWKVRKEEQRHLITSIRKTAVVASIAAQLQCHELIVRVVCLGYNLSQELLEDDEMQLAGTLMNPLLVLIVALQVVPKRHWHSVEHSIYCRMIIHVLRLAVYTRNVSPVAVLLSKVYPEAKDEAENKVSEAVESEYVSLLRSLSISNKILMSGSAGTVSETDLLELLTHTTKRASNSFLSNDYLWKQVPENRRLAFVTGQSQAFVVADVTAVNDAGNLSRWLKERPENMSDTLVLLSALCRELALQGASDKIIPLLTKVQIFDKTLAPAIQSIIEPWNLKFILKMPSPEEMAAAAIAAAEAAAAAAGGGKGKKAPPAKGAAPPPAEPEITAEQFALPDRYNNVSAQEMQKQLKALADISRYLAVSCFASLKDRDYFPQTRDGPTLVLDPSVMKHLEWSDDVKAKLDKFAADGNVLEEAPAPAPAPAAVAPSGKGAAAVPEVVVPPPIPLNLINSKQQFVKHAAVSISLYTQAQCPGAVIATSVNLWNYIVDNWVDPVIFSVDCVSVKSVLMQGLFSVLQQLEALVGLPSANASPFELPAHTTEKAVKEYLLLVKELGVFLIKCLWLYKDFKEVVDAGSRFVNIFVIAAPEFCKTVGLSLFPLMKHAQEQIIDAAQVLVNLRKDAIVVFVNDFEEAMKKKRRKKLRIARLEKDEDEIKFELERDELQALVSEAEMELRMNEDILERVKGQKKAFDNQFPTGIQLLDKVRVVSKEIIKDTFAEMVEEDNNDPRAVLRRSRELAARLTDVMEQFTTVGHFLREKKDRLTLIETLKEQSDLLLFFGRNKEASLILMDVVDGFFNVMDALANWKAVTSEALTSFDPLLMSGVIPVVVALGKLSRYCGARDWDLKSSCCRMAAEVCRLPFSESYGHPQTLYGFAAYDCRELGGLASLSFNADKLVGSGICVALNEIVTVLSSEDIHLEQLPVLTLLEHYHGAYTRRPEEWMAARLKRVKALIACHLFSEAAAMIASLQPTIKTIRRGQFQVPIIAPNDMTTLTQFDSAKNGLDYYGRNEFFNHLPPHHESNKKALSWVAAFPAEFATFASEFTIKLPVPVLSEEEIQARKAAREAEAAAAAALAAKDKKASAKVKAAPVVEVVEDSAPTKPLFPPILLAELTAVCAQFHLKVATLDCRVTTPHSASLVAYGTSGLQLVDQSLALLGTNFEVESVKSDPKWMSVYLSSRVGKIKYQVAYRKLREARSSLFALVQLLQGLLSPKVMDVYYPPDAAVRAPPAEVLVQPTPTPLLSEVQFIIAQAWFTCKELLADIAERQARCSDALIIASQTAQDASMTLSNFWLRKALLSRARIHYKVGNLGESEVDATAVVACFENKLCEDLGYIRALCLQASILRERALCSSSEVAGQVGKTCLSILKKARAVAERFARSFGFLGADSNISYVRATTAEMKFERLPGLLHNISEIHSNEPELSLRPAVDKKLLEAITPSYQKTKASATITTTTLDPSPSSPTRTRTELAQTMSSPTRTLGLDASAVSSQSLPLFDDDCVVVRPVRKPEHLWNGRLAPIDATETVVVESEFGNIYLAGVRVLGVVHASLSSLLLELLNCNGCFDSSEVSAGGKRLMTARQKQLASQKEKKSKIFNKADLSYDLAAVCEDGLKVLRHTVYASSFVRSSLLCSCGSSRDFASQVGSTPPSVENFDDYFVSPLKAAIAIGVQGTYHPWQLMRKACLELVDRYGNSSIQLSEDPATRLKLATLYLISAIKLGTQHASIRNGVLTLCSLSPALSNSTSKDLSDIISACTSSSATIPPLVAVLEEAPAAGGKGAKPPAKGAPAPAAAAGVSSGRDALFLLMTTQREADSLWLDGYDRDLCCDLHQLLRKEFEPYQSKCLLNAVPDAAAQLSITASSISVAYIPTKAPSGFAVPAGSPEDCGLYSHLLVYFLIGPKVAPNAVAAAPVDPKAKGAKAGAAPVVETVLGDPVLTKVVLFRPHVTQLERACRTLRATLKEAIAKDWPDVSTACAAKFGAILSNVSDLMKLGYIPAVETDSGDAEPESEVPPEEDSSAVKPVVEVLAPSEGRTYSQVKITVDDHSSVLPVNDDCIGRLADVLTTVRDCDSLVDNDLCGFLRLCLGYVEN